MKHLDLIADERGVRLLTRGEALKHAARLALATVLLGIVPSEATAEALDGSSLGSSGAAAAFKRIRIAHTAARTVTKRLRADRSCRKIDARMRAHGLKLKSSKGAVLKPTWKDVRVAVMVATYTSRTKYGFMVWYRRGRRINSCFVIRKRKKTSSSVVEAATLRAAGENEPRLRNLDAEAVSAQVTHAESLASASSAGVHAASFECRICQLAVNMIINVGCGLGAALIAAALCGPGAPACLLIAGLVHAAFCEVLFYPVDRKIVCRGLGYC